MNTGNSNRSSMQNFESSKDKIEKYENIMKNKPLASPTMQ
jgi:hypothetical protein